MAVVHQQVDPVAVEGGFLTARAQPRNIQLRGFPGAEFFQLVDDVLFAVVEMLQNAPVVVVFFFQPLEQMTDGVEQHFPGDLVDLFAQILVQAADGSEEIVDFFLQPGTALFEPVFFPVGKFFELLLGERLAVFQRHQHQAAGHLLQGESALSGGLFELLEQFFFPFLVLGGNLFLLFRVLLAFKAFGNILGQAFDQPVDVFFQILAGSGGQLNVLRAFSVVGRENVAPVIGSCVFSRARAQDFLDRRRAATARLAEDKQIVAVIPDPQAEIDRRKGPRLTDGLFERRKIRGGGKVKLSEGATPAESLRCEWLGHEKPLLSGRRERRRNVSQCSEGKGFSTSVAGSDGFATGCCGSLQPGPENVFSTAGVAEITAGRIRR